MQTKNLNLANVITLITITKLHLNDIVNLCEDTNSNFLMKIESEIVEKLRSVIHFTADENAKTILKN